MKSRFWIMALAAAAVLGLSGCTTVYNHSKNLKTFEAGESVIYIHVKGTTDDMTAIKSECQNNIPGKYSAKGLSFFKANICPNLHNMQLVKGFFYSSPFGGIQLFTPFADKSLKIERDDIVKVGLSFDAEGAPDRPGLVLSIARKSKDVSKESGCYWEGAGMFTNAFISGGVVCDGWDWKKQKFAQ